VPKANPCFQPYKNIHQGKSAAVMGCGPTLSQYDGSKNLIHIGCNELIYSPEYSLDYYFIGDSQVAWPDKNKTFHKDPDTYNAYRANIAKFVRDHPQDACSVIKENNGEKVDHAIHYQVGPPGISYGQFQAVRETKFQQDIVENYMYSRISISWEMMQFALWTGVSRIYLMGQDCSYAKGTVHNPHVRNYGGVPRVGLVRKWEELKTWISLHYPGVEVMCVNPDAMNHYKEISIDDIVEN
tara:strand:- start:901 stop:1620 length:720 start_codon:yes stop_codon:yes gene_type:complete